MPGRKTRSGRTPGARAGEARGAGDGGASDRPIGRGGVGGSGRGHPRARRVRQPTGQARAAALSPVRRTGPGGGGSEGHRATPPGNFPSTHRRPPALRFHLTVAITTLSLVLLTT